jgi:transcription-repair coupling factor (superfamily II helicase)
MEFVPEHTVVWLKDWTLIQQRGNDQMEALEAFLLHAPILKITDDADTHKKNTDKDDFVAVEKVIEQVFNKPIIEWGFQANLTKQKLAFSTQVQPSFNRQFQYLIYRSMKRKAMICFYSLNKPSN